MQMRKWSLRILILAVSMLYTSGCMSFCPPLVSGPHPPVTLSAWTAWWKMADGVGELKRKKRKLSSVASFGVCFDSEDKLIMPDEMDMISPRALEKFWEKPVYLTIVNDVRQKNGNYLYKDTAVLHRVLANRERCLCHVAEIVKMAKKHNYDGIDLDYECVFKDESLVKPYLDFTYLLAKAAIDNDLKLRIVLEPSADFGAGFVKGPEYVVMLYNLYGTHGDPGPKADAAFIEKTIKKMQALPGKKSVAFATGGCVWERSGFLNLGSGPYKKYIDEKQAVELRDKYKAEVKRDAGSAALCFNYEEKGKKYTVWYADSETLNAWITLAANNGIESVALWRLGGNTSIDEVKR